MWSRDRLAELVEKRREAKEMLPQAEEAVLAYARWQGLTNEEHVDQAAAKETLDRICDAAEPEEWSKLAALVGEVDDGLLEGLHALCAQPRAGRCAGGSPHSGRPGARFPGAEPQAVAREKPLTSSAPPAAQAVALFLELMRGLMHVDGA